MRNMKIGRCCLAGLFLWIVQGATAQINYGTTGLMNLPTADMQRDKTFMAGGNWLNHHATVPRWWYDTWNYYSRSGPCGGRAAHRRQAACHAGGAHRDR